MREFLVLIGQIFAIALLQIVLEVFIDPGKKPNQAMLINIACFLGSLYLLLEFVYNHILKNMSGISMLPF